MVVAVGVMSMHHSYSLTSSSYWVTDLTFMSGQMAGTVIK